MDQQKQADHLAKDKVLKQMSNVLNQEQESNKSTIILDPYRFVNLALFVSVGLTTSIPTQAFAGISPAIKDIYGVSALEVNMNSLFFPIMYVIMILPANYFLDKKGLKPGLIYCEIMMCLGMLIRCFINTSFYLFLFGTFICSLGFCIMLSSGNKFATAWFPQSEISTANSIALFSIFASDSIGYYVSTIFISKQSTKEDVQRFFIAQSIIIVILNILMIILFRGEPKHPQNHSSTAKRQNYRKDIKKLFKNKNYLKLFASMTCIVATLSVTFIGVSWFGEAYGYSIQECGYIIMIANFTGMIGCVLSGIYKKDKYKQKCQYLLFGSIVGYSVIVLGQEVGQMWILYTGAAVMGLCMFPFLTTITDFSTQTTFPIGEATAGGSLLFGGQTAGFIFVILFSLYIDDQITIEKARVVQIMLLVLPILSLIAISFSEETLERKDYEERKALQICSQINALEGPFKV